MNNIYNKIIFITLTIIIIIVIHPIETIITNYIIYNKFIEYTDGDNLLSRCYKGFTTKTLSLQLTNIINYYYYNSIS